MSSEYIDISKANSNNAYIIFSRFNTLSYYIKSIQVPSITTGATRIGMPQHHAWNIPSVTSDVDDITIMWFLDENYVTYFNMLNWMYECRRAADVSTVMSDATITITNNAKQPIINIHLKDTWPYNIGTLDFDTYTAEPLVPFFTIKSHGFSWTYLDSSLDIYNGKS